MRKVVGEHPFCVLKYMNSHIFHICFIWFILLSYLIFDFVCLTLSSADIHGITKYARTYMGDTHTHAHTHKKKENRQWVQKKIKEWGRWCFNGGRSAWVLRRAGPHTNNARSTWMFFQFCIICKRTNNANNATHYVKLGKKRRESSKRNYDIISPRVTIKAIIINNQQDSRSRHVMKVTRRHNK